MLRDKKLIILSLLLGLIAAAMFYFYTEKILMFGGGAKKSAESAETLVRVIVAAKDIPRRTELTPSMLTAVEMPAKYAHPDAMGSIKSCVGRVTVDRLIKGQPALSRNLRPENAPSELSFVVPEGQRAITVAATITSGVGNMLKPGDYVDVIVSLDEKRAGREVSFLLLRSASVLAVDTSIVGRDESGKLTGKMGGSVEKGAGYQSVTLAAIPEDCVKLSLAESVGEIKLALSPPEETNERRVKAYSAVADLARDAGFKIIPQKEGTGSGGAAGGGRAPARTEIEIVPAGPPLPDAFSATAGGSMQAAPAAAPLNTRVVRIMRGVQMETVATGRVNDTKRGD